MDLAMAPGVAVTEQYALFEPRPPSREERAVVLASLPPPPEPRALLLASAHKDPLAHLEACPGCEECATLRTNCARCSRCAAWQGREYMRDGLCSWCQIRA